VSDEKTKPDKDAAAAPRSKKPIEYRRFEEVLKKVIKAPPLRESKEHMPKIDAS
jgi:hypothetical protein